MRSRLRLLGWFALLIGSLVALRAGATGELSTPPLTSASAVLDWVDTRTPAATALAIVRLVTECAVWYVLAVTLVHLSAGAFGGRRASALADMVSIPGVARVIHAAVGLGLLATASVTNDDQASRVSGTATMQPVGVGTAAMRPQIDESDGTAWMRPDQPPTPAPPPPSTWRTEPGDSLWSIATEVLAAAWQRQPTDDEVDPFWRTMIDANRGRLVDGDDPDLIHPGQVFDIPTAPEAEFPRSHG